MSKKTLSNGVSIKEVRRVIRKVMEQDGYERLGPKCINEPDLTFKNQRSDYAHKKLGKKDRTTFKKHIKECEGCRDESTFLSTRIRKPHKPREK